MRETDERTSIGQRDAGRRLGERVTDVTFWRNELNTELEKLVAEAALLADCKRNVQKALQVQIFSLQILIGNINIILFKGHGSTFAYC